MMMSCSWQWVPPVFFGWFLEERVKSPSVKIVTDSAESVTISKIYANSFRWTLPGSVDSPATSTLAYN